MKLIIRDLLYLESIIEYINKIERIVNTLNNNTMFGQDEYLYDSLLITIVNIGECVSNISDDLQHKYSDVEWRKIKDMRNLIVHDYVSVDIEQTLFIAKNHIPTLKVQITKIIEEIS
jgi:uncharacterized protein with HEPN domain